MSSGHELTTFQSFWLSSSGVSPHAGIAIEHGVLLSTLYLLICYDALNPLNLASAEMICRRPLMIQRAVRRLPKSPDFEGLDVYLSQSFDSSGGVITSEFDRHIADIKKGESLVLKQERLFREEQEALSKKKQKDKNKAAGSGGAGGGD